MKQLQCVQSSDARVWRGRGDEAGYVGEGRCAPQQSTLPSVRQTTSIAAAVLMIGAHSPLHIAQRTSASLRLRRWRARRWRAPAVAAGDGRQQRRIGAAALVHLRRWALRSSRQPKPAPSAASEPKARQLAVPG